MASKLIVLFGPPAVGKAAVGKEICELTGFRFFHNHLTADPVISVLGYDGELYRPICDDFRLRILSAAVENQVEGVVFTFGWDMDSSRDRSLLNRMHDIFLERGGSIVFVELLASRKVREARIDTPFRRATKPRFPDLESARAYLEEVDRSTRMNSDGQIPFDDLHITIDTERYTEAAAAAEILRRIEVNDRASQGNSDGFPSAPA